MQFAAKYENNEEKFKKLILKSDIWKKYHNLIFKDIGQKVLQIIE